MKKRYLVGFVGLTAVTLLLTGCGVSSERLDEWQDDAQKCVDKDGHPLFLERSGFFTNETRFGCILPESKPTP